MELLKNTPLEKLNESIEKTFSPVRMIIKSDEIFNKYITRPSKVELDFLVISIESNLTSFGYESELNKWFRTLTKELEIFAQAISIINVELNDPEWKRVFEEIRMASQNFTYSFYMGNYYTAAVECRKLLEGIIWLSFWGKELPDRANEAEGFVPQLEDESIKELFRYTSDLIHRKNPIMNTIVENGELELKEFFVKLKSASNDIIKNLNKVFESENLQDNPTFGRWHKLIKIYKSEVRTKTMPLVENDIYKVAYRYEVMDFYSGDPKDLSSEDIMNFRNKVQKMIINEEDLQLNKYLRLSAVLRANNSFGLAPATVDKRILYIYENRSKLDKKLLIYIPLISTAHSGLVSTMKFLESLPARDRALGKYKKIITSVISRIFDMEMSLDRDVIQLLFIRRLLEEYFSSICIGKHGLAHPIVKIHSFLRSKKVDIDDIKSFKYKHIQKDEGLKYVSNDGVSTGSEEIDMDEVIKVIDKAFNYLKNLPKKNNM